MAGFAVIGAIRINTSTPQWLEQGGLQLGIMDIFQRNFRRHDIVSGRVYRQMQLAPDSPFLGAVFSDFLWGLSISHRHRAGPLAYTTVIGGTKRHVHQLEQGVESSQAGPQSEVKNPLEHQEGYRWSGRCRADCGPGAHDADLKRRVVIRSPSPQLVPQAASIWETTPQTVRCQVYRDSMMIQFIKTTVG